MVLKVLTPGRTRRNDLEGWLQTEMLLKILAPGRIRRNDLEGLAPNRKMILKGSGARNEVGGLSSCGHLS
jgi:hypothetical protein